MIKRALHFGLVVASAVAPTSVHSQGTAGQRATFDSVGAYVARMLDSTRTTSLAVAVASGGRIVWEQGYGHADVEQKVAATSRTLYSLASVTKPYTATAIMKLVHEGKIDLDRPVNDYLRTTALTGLAGDAAGATVRRVLSHTAGLPLHARFFYEGSDTRPSMKEAIDRYGIIVFPPGRVYNYANLGYGILEQVIADVSGRSYEDYLREAIFEPLGLRETTIGSGVGIANSAVRYDAQTRRIPFYDFDHRGASAIWASARDLVRFGMAHAGARSRAQARVLPDSLLDAMQRVSVSDSTGGSYALGWSVQQDNGIHRVGHSGGMPGVTAYLYVFPKDDIVIGTLSNKSSNLPARVATMIAEGLMPAMKTRAVPARPAEESGTDLTFAAPQRLLGEWSGTLRTYDRQEVPMSVVVSASHAHVRLLVGIVPLWTVLNNPQFSRDRLGGQLMVDVPTDDTRRHGQMGDMSLRLDGDTLRGYLVSAAVTSPPKGGVPSYVHLVRKGAGGARGPGASR